MFKVLGLLAVLAVPGASETELPVQQCASSEVENRQVVTDFFTHGLIRKQVRESFEQYVRPNFIEHQPNIGGGSREDAILYLEDIIKRNPAGKWRVLRTMADGDMVVVHARFAPAPGAPEYAIADFFRLENCKIVEHWGVVSPPNENAAAASETTLDAAE